MERFVIVMPVAESICAEWEVPLEAPGEGERFQTFNPD